MSTCSDGAREGWAHRRGERGFNLVELLMSMAIATAMFMATVTLYVGQGEAIQQQNEVVELQREARFALDHLRRDLTSLGSNATPNSEVDPFVCPKPAITLRALTATLQDGYVSNPALNPSVGPMSLTLFGSLDVKQRFRTASIDGAKVFLFDDGKLPGTQEAFDATFSTDRYLRVSGADGKQMYLPILSADFSDKSVTVDGVVPQVGAGQVCGYAGFGQNYWIDVQGFVRYRIVADLRPGAPMTNGQAEGGLLVRERMQVDGTTPVSQVILAENAVDFGITDVGMDGNPAPESLSLQVHYMGKDVVDADGKGLLGNDSAARPEALRFLSVRVSLRAAGPDRDLTHTARTNPYAPLETWKVADDGRGVYRVHTVGTRVSLPTLVSRNL